MTDNNIQAFFALVRAGLWEKDVRLSPYGDVDYAEIMRLAQEQAVKGLVAAGLEYVTDVKVPQEWALQFAAQTIQLEQRNKAMNGFISDIVEKMRNAGIYTLIVKGQGVAQCYERPLWRSCGDVDLYLGLEEFSRAREYLRPLAQKIEPDNNETKHINMVMKDSGWVVEIHGDQYTELSFKIDRGLDDVHKSIFYNGDVRVWEDDKTVVYLPSADNDVLIVFTHYLKHFFKGGLGLRQICDWCRLLWKYKGTTNRSLLEKRIKEMGLIPEWNAFAYFSIEYLGMPVEAMPISSSGKQLKRKAKYILNYILGSGNFGHNKDLSFYRSRWYLIRKFGAMCYKIGSICRHALVFPNTIVFIPTLIYNGLRSVSRGE
jgi:hypothetical protein